MAKEFEDSLDSFARPGRLSAGFWLSTAAGSLIFAGAVGAAVYGSPVAAGVSGIVGAAVLILAAQLEFGRQRNRNISNALIPWDNSSPEVQRRNVDLAVGELTRKLGADASEPSQLQSAFIVAADLALRQIQQEEAAPILRNVVVAGIPFDAAFVKNGLLICCETALLVTPELGQERVNAMLRKASAVKNAIEKLGGKQSIRLMPVVITQMSAEDAAVLRRSLSTERFASTQVNIDIRLLDFEALQRIYLTDGTA